MHRKIALAAAALMAATLASKPAPAAQGSAAPIASPSLLRTVQFYGAGPDWGGDRWERRQQWREWRRERDEARIAEAARQEAWRIEQEREQRRAWRRAMREQQGYGPAFGPGYGFQRGW